MKMTCGAWTFRNNLRNFTSVSPPRRGLFGFPKHSLLHCRLLLVTGPYKLAHSGGE